MGNPLAVLAAAFAAPGLPPLSGRIRIIEPAQAARLGIPELPVIPKLMASVSHLPANDLLAYKIESGEARVTYGPRIREIAKQWGVTPRERETA